MPDQGDDKNAYDVLVERLLVALQEIADRRAETRVRAAFGQGFAACLAQVQQTLGEALDGISPPDGMPDLSTSPTPKYPSHTSINRLGLRNNLGKKLMAAQQATIADVLDIDDAELRDLERVGEGSIRHLDSTLADAGYMRLPETSVADLGLPPELVDNLEDHSIRTLRQLHRRFRKRDMPDFGEPSIGLLLTELERHLRGIHR
jgi:hypothetical protein